MSGLARQCNCITAHRACEGGKHVAGSARYTSEMVCLASETMLDSLAQRRSTEDVARAQAGEISDDDDDEDGEQEFVSDDDDDDEQEIGLPVHEGDDDADDIIQTSRKGVVTEPHEVGNDRQTEFSSTFWLEHVENDHFPKLAWCPICQWADGTTFAHRRLRRTEIGMFAVDLAGPLAPDLNGRRYMVSAVYVSFHNHQELILPFVELVGSRLAQEVVEAIELIVQH
eukprot:5878078-Amphidinium_carterae.1